MAIIVNNALNFGMTLFAIYFMEKMSRATWSIEHQDTEETEMTTQMDREVAAKWFDKMLVDFDF